VGEGRRDPPPFPLVEAVRPMPRRPKPEKPVPAQIGLVRWRADRSDQKRQDILDGARREFLSNGFGGASVDSVAQAAGVAKTTVYRHFQSKQALFAGVVTQLCERIVGADFALDPQEPPEDALTKFGWRVIETVFDMTTVGLQRIVIAEGRRFPEIGQLFYASGPEVCVSVLEHYLERNMSANPLRCANAREAAENFIENLRGYLHLRVLLGIEALPTRPVMARRVEAAVAHLIAQGRIGSTPIPASSPPRTRRSAGH
jgi:TetR/AcrR family transcriptional repressor of mexJK operon